MRIPLIMFSAASIVALGGIASADDHLFQASTDGRGLDGNLNAQASEHSEEAPGQGSPFTGEVMQTPASLTAGGNPVDGIDPKPHANVKPREPK
jgi:hypothetical protein